MKYKIILLAVLTAMTVVVSGQPQAEPASIILDQAYTRAAKEKKNVMVIFHASWCGWCKKLDAAINDPACREFFDRSYVITHLTINESSANKNLENPGAIEIFNDNGGNGEGIPYFLIYNSKGKLLADSKMTVAVSGSEPKLTNIGCPVSVEEIAAFIEILKKTSEITGKEIAEITGRFKNNGN
jgi:thiol-disulfide isomerase/thioredoxin